jgi:hypothetical protein
MPDRPMKIHYADGTSVTVGNFPMSDLLPEPTAEQIAAAKAAGEAEHAEYLRWYSLTREEQIRELAKS